ncbi:MAG: CRTAC1 family protein [Caldilineaceae bacterium]|nr:CRTAC1 family protein [Caldilineaceae bacterium]
MHIIDVDGDGLLDIVFTRTISAPNFWRNQGDGRFQQEVLPAIDKPIYAMNWADMDGDDDLDLVGATYDAAQLAEFSHEYLESAKAGVYVYERLGDGYTVTRLAEQAQALALILVDLDDDDQLDILVGNDFAVPDMAWIRNDGGWLPDHSFGATSHSTMSFDFGDLDNDGNREIFSTDMKPAADDPQTLAAWAPVMAGMMDEAHDPNDPQVMANVLQTLGPDGAFVDQADERGIDASGWSWSGKFGDLDQDGFLDLYIVNGMMEATTFAHLPNHELVEENQAFRNLGDGRFALASDWALGSTLSGRGMSMGDLDGDGDLDIVVNNLRGPALLLENQLCSGSSLQVDLFWPARANSRAIGAELTLHTDRGPLYRQVRAGSGYLSGDPARIHFGFPEDAALDRLEIRWPDGRRPQ